MAAGVYLRRVLLCPIALVDFFVCLPIWAGTPQMGCLLTVGHPQNACWVVHEQRNLLFHLEPEARFLTDVHGHLM